MISTLSYEQDYSSKVWEKTVDFPISISKGSEPAKPKLKLKTKMGLAEKGDITIRDVVT